MTALILFLTGCGSQPDTNIYTLYAIDPAVPVALTVSPVTVGQINLPAILDRNQLIRRASPDHIVVLPFDRWAAPLDDTISKTLTVDLEHRLTAPSLVRSNGTPYDTSVGIIDLYIDRFDADFAGHVTFDVAWTLTRGNPQKTIIDETDHLSAEAADGSPGAMVQAMSQALADFAAKVAARLPAR